MYQNRNIDTHTRARARKRLCHLLSKGLDGEATDATLCFPRGDSGTDSIVFRLLSAWAGEFNFAVAVVVVIDVIVVVVVDVDVIAMAAAAAAAADFAVDDGE